MMGGGGGHRGGFGRNTTLTEEEKQNRPRVTLPFVKRILSFLKPYKLHLALVLVCILCSALLELLPSILTGYMIDLGFIGRDFSLLTKLALASVVVLLLSNLIGVLESYLNTWMAQQIMYDMKNEMYAHMQRMSHRFFTVQKQGDIITRMTSDISGVQSVIVFTLTNMVRNVAVLTTTAAALFSKNVILACVGITVVPLFLLPSKYVGKTRWGIATQTQQKDDEANQVLNETLSVSGQLLVKLFTNEQREYKKFADIGREVARLNVKESMAGRWFRMTLSTFINLGPMLIYLVGGYLIIRQGVADLTVGDITVVVALLSRLYAPINSLLGVQVDFVRSMALFSRIFEFYDLPVEVDNIPDAITLTRTEGKVEFKNVNFHYDPGQPVLHDISFTMHPGRMVALVGASGSGKSTITNLIPRLYDVTGGAVLLDGTDLRAIDLSSLRRSIGVVTQDTYLFNGTVRENLLYAKWDATEEELIDACKKSNIHDFIATLPLGYDTLVGNRGLKLSGGEKQRVSLARVILKDPQILILDEATSSLDSISESQIQQATRPLLKGRSSLVVAHRLSTIIEADEILVLQKGRIVERGTHERLIETSGIYRELYETQFHIQGDE